MNPNVAITTALLAGDPVIPVWIVISTIVVIVIITVIAIVNIK